MRGSRNKILVDNDGLEILRRAKELEEKTKDLKVVQNLIKGELQSAKEEPNVSWGAYVAKDELV